MSFIRKLTVTKRIIVLLCVTAVIVASAGVLLHARTASHTTPSRTATTGNGSHINYDPPTQAEKDAAQTNKAHVVQEQNATASGGSIGNKQVSVVVANASQEDQQITVNAFTSDVFENGGKCTATFTQGNTQFSKTVSANENASTTDCAPIRVNRSEFSAAGSWQVTVGYSSSTASGTSASVTFTVK